MRAAPSCARRRPDRDDARALASGRARAPPGWATDLAVLELTGSTIQDNGDHLLICTAANPDFHWGNCIFVTDEAAVDDAQQWVETFRAAFPHATWVAIGLIRMPDYLTAWESQGCEVELNDVLTTDTMPQPTPRPRARPYAGSARPTGSGRSTELVTEYPRGGEDPVMYETFVRRHVAARRALSERDLAAFFGAFADGELAGGISRRRNYLSGGVRRRLGSAPFSVD